MSNKQIKTKFPMWMCMWMWMDDIFLFCFLFHTQVMFDQSGRKCGVGSQRTCSHFSAPSAYFNNFLLDLSLSLSGSLWLSATPTLALSGSLLLSNFAYTVLDRLSGPLLCSQRRCHAKHFVPVCISPPAMYLRISLLIHVRACWKNLTFPNMSLEQGSILLTPWNYLVSEKKK